MGETPSVFEHLQCGMQINPDADAIIVIHQSSNHLAELVRDESHRNEETLSSLPYLKWTYRQLHSAAVRVANGLFAAGIKPGRSTIISLLPNGIEYAILLWTSFLLRVTLSNLDAEALKPMRAAELTAFIKTLSPDVVLVPDSQGAQAFDAVIKDQGLGAPSIKIAMVPENLPQGWNGLLELGLSEIQDTEQFEASLIDQARHDDPARVAMVLFTSGTSSGQPKGCPKTVGQIGHILASPPLFTVGPSARMLLQTASFRVIALVICLYTWDQGGCVVMPSAAFDVNAILTAIEKVQINALLLVPFQLHAVVDHARFKSTRTESVKILRTGADIITKDLLVKFKRAFSSASDIAVANGMTEGNGLLHWPYGSDIEQYPYFSGIAPIGKVAKGAKLKIVDVDTSKTTGRGEPGELHVSSGAFINNYLGGIKPEDFYQNEQGSWFKTGDLGMISQDGDLYLLGRTKDIIKRAGVPVTPAALESCIEKNSNVLVCINPFQYLYGLTYGKIVLRCRCAAFDSRRRALCCSSRLGFLVEAATHAVCHRRTGEGLCSRRSSFTARAWTIFVSGQQNG